jgi:hypothetical protein
VSLVGNLLQLEYLTVILGTYLGTSNLFPGTFGNWRQYLEYSEYSEHFHVVEEQGK